MGIDGVNFDAKFAAYEKYLKANADKLGLKGDKLAEQFGRYSVGLQYDQIKADKKAFGKQYGKELALERQAKRNEYVKFWENALDEKDKMDAKKARIRKEIAEIKGRKSGVVLADEIAEAKISANTNNAKVAELEKQLKYERGKLERFKKLAQDKGQISGVVKADEIAEAKIRGTAEPANSKVAELEKQLKYERGKLERFKKLAQNKGQVSGVVKADEIAAAKILENQKGGSKITKLLKGKKGKAGLIAAAVLAVGAGITALVKSGKKDDTAPVNENLELVTDPENIIGPVLPEEEAADTTGTTDTTDTTVVIPPAGSDTTEVTSPDGADTTKTAPTEEVPEQLIIPGADGAPSDLYTVVKGDNVWNIAKAHLKELHKDVEGYKPTNLEILNHTKEIMELNGLKYEADGYRVLIYPEDKLKLSA